MLLLARKEERAEERLWPHGPYMVERSCASMRRERCVARIVDTFHKRTETGFADTILDFDEVEVEEDSDGVIIFI